jgi:hypothetical protein
MKKLMTLAAVAATWLVSCKKDSNTFIPPVPTFTKSVNFVIQQGRDYSAPQFNGVDAELKLAISRVRKSDGNTILVWDSTVAFKSLRSYPEAQLPATVLKSVSGIDDNKETVSASYMVRYRDAQQQISTQGKNEFANIGSTVLTFPVRL